MPPAFNSKLQCVLQLFWIKNVQFRVEVFDHLFLGNPFSEPDCTLRKLCMKRQMYFLGRPSRINIGGMYGKLARRDFSQFMQNSKSWVWTLDNTEQNMVIIQGKIKTCAYRVQTKFSHLVVKTSSQSLVHKNCLSN